MKHTGNSHSPRRVFTFFFLSLSSGTFCDFLPSRLTAALTELTRMKARPTPRRPSTPSSTTTLRMRSYRLPLGNAQPCTTSLVRQRDSFLQLHIVKKRCMACEGRIETPRISVMETRLLLSAVAFYFSSPSENNLFVLFYKSRPQPFQSSCLFPQAPVKGPSPCRRGRSWPWWRRTKATAGPASAGATETKATFPRPTSPSPWTNDTLVQRSNASITPSELHEAPLEM